MEIIAYITDQKERILSSDALTLYITDPKERDAYLASIGKALRADVIQLSNGDHMVVRKKENR